MTDRVRRGALVAALVSVNLALVAWVAWGDPAGRPPTPTSTSASTSASAGRDGADAPPGPRADAVAGPVVLALAADGTVLRATRGSCDDEAALRVALAAPGAGPRPVTAPPLRTVRAARADAAGFVLAGADTRCRPAAARTDDGGRTWRRTALPRMWLLGEDVRRPLLAPGGRAMPAPASCPAPRDVIRTTDDTAYLVCDAGVEAIGRAPASGPWALEGVRQVAMDSPRRGVALVADAACDARAYLLVSGGADWLPGPCLGEGVEPLGVVMRGETVVAQVGSVLRASRDGGRTWGELASSG